jgi:hypothetical protein
MTNFKAHIVKIFKGTLYLIFYFELKKIKKFQNSFQGQECYILGDSAQIKYYDLSLFDDKPMFCFNVSYMHLDLKKRNKPIFALTVEPFYFIKDRIKRIKNTLLLKKTPINMAYYTHKYIVSNKIDFIMSLTNLMSFFRNRTYSIFLQLPNDMFTSIIRKTNYKWNAGVFQASIALAIFMGFKKVTVIGVSYHSNSVIYRWFHKGLGTSIPSESDRHLNPNSSNSIQLIEYFEVAKKFIEIEILTPKENDESTLFKNISYTNYTGRELNYRENIEIADKSFLEACTNSKHAVDIGKIF